MLQAPKHGIVYKCENCHNIIIGVNYAESGSAVEILIFDFDRVIDQGPSL